MGDLIEGQGFVMLLDISFTQVFGVKADTEGAICILGEGQGVVSLVTGMMT